MALSYLSILWADSGANALDSANKLLLYLLLAWTLALVPWTAARLAWLLGIWSLGVAIVCAIDLVRLHGAVQFGPSFYDLRYATPLGYPNATAGIATMAMWPALVLSARREVPAAIRIALFPVAAFLAGFAFLPQSRAALLGLLVTAPVVLLLASRRVALFVRILLIGGGLAFVIPRTVSLYQAVDGNHLVRPSLDRALSGLLLVSVVALAVSSLLVLIEHRVIPQRVADWRPAPGPVARRVLITAACVLVVAVGIAGAVGLAHLGSTLVKNGRTDASVGANRFLSASPEERTDYVRVAWHLFTHAPIGGVGAGNFGVHYDALRHFPKHSQYAHDLFMRVLSETGAVGLLLLLVALGALGWGLVRAIRTLPGIGRAAAAAALGLALYFLVHDSLDWMDEFPALAAPALSSLLIVGALASPRRAAAPDAPSPRRWHARAIRVSPRLSGWGIAVGLIAELALTLALAGPYLASRLETRAQREYVVHPSRAYHALSQAADLDPLSSGPMLTEGQIAVALDEDDRAQSAFRQALAREDGWYPRLELAVLLAQDGQFPAALRQAQLAGSLDRDDPLIGQVTALINAHQRIDPLAFSDRYFQGAQANVFQQRAIR